VEWPSAERPRPLFDGQSLAGWHGKAGRYWSVEHGSIVGRNVPADAPQVSRRGPCGHSRLALGATHSEPQHRGVRRNGNLAVRLCLCRPQGQLEYVLSMKPSSSESLSSMFQSLLISNWPCQVSTYLFSDSTHKSFRLLFEMRLVHSEVGSYMNRMLSSQRTARTQRRLFPPAAAP
jgi:hypothetical protein